MRWLLRWSERSVWRRLVMIAGMLLIPGAVGVLIGRVGGVTAVSLGVVALVVYLTWAVATLPRYRPSRTVWTQVQFDPANGPKACALCGYNCIGGGFWTPVPGHMNAVMHTMGCGPVLPGEEPMADPTHRRELGGRYVQLDG